MEERGWPRGLERQLCYGGDYNPEQWPPEVRDEDIDLMRRAGVNLVSLGVFAWSLLEPREGEYEFDWLDQIMDQLHRGDLRAALATPTASPPPWFSLAHPDALPIRADGTRLSHGSRDTYCPSAPAYRSAAVGIATALSRRYADHPALALWHVHNEYGTVCHCDHVATAFRQWLRERYQTLDRLNEAWTGAFWSQVYGDWPQILPPRATQYLGNPAQLLDFRRFLASEMLACFREQRAVLRAITPDIPITTNFVFGSWVPVDQWAWADDVDLVALDHYPEAPETAAPETAFAADLARGWAAGRPWLLMEQAPNLVYAKGRMHTKQPGELTRLSLSHVARGSRGAMFFQWRAPRGGAEAFGSAMVPHAGPGARVFAEVCTLGATLSTVSSLPASQVVADVAMIWDPQSWWALQGPGLPSDRLDYLAQVRAVHAAAYRLGITVDIVSPHSDVAAYKVVLAPSLFLVSAQTASLLGSYVEAGGSLAVWYFSGIADLDHRIWPSGYPGPLREVLGVRVEELHPLAEADDVRLAPAGVGRDWTELVRLCGAEVEASYASGPLAAEPAVTRHRYGSGRARYVSTSLDESSLDELVGRICAEAGVAPVSGSGHGVEAVRRTDGTLFLINHGPATVEIAVEGGELISGIDITGRLRLNGGAVAVVRTTSSTRR
jgi:beta-galactosidase